MAASSGGESLIEGSGQDGQSYRTVVGAQGDGEQEEYEYGAEAHPGLSGIALPGMVLC